MTPTDFASWQDDWIWGLPLIVFTIVIHVFGLGLISALVVGLVDAIAAQRRPTAAFALIMGLVALLVTVLHAIGGIAWAVTYYLLGALPNVSGAVLYSFGAMTAYGHASMVLEPHWQLMGTLEALNGLILFGLTTAFMFAMIEQAGPTRLWRRNSKHQIRRRKVFDGDSPNSAL